jgi:hydroxyethylthiazole kinase-like uncharacterized protein yjeF
MRPVLTADQMAQLDAFTIERLGLEGRILMSNAAREVLAAITERWPQARRLLILCGTGNNGGDGLALAYYAQQCGLSASAVLCRPGITDPPALSTDAEHYYNLCQRAFVPVELLVRPALLPEIVTSASADVIVDAIFGIGLNRPLEEYFSSLIERLNQTSRPVVSVDCPSGLECSSARDLGPVVEADMTVTFGHPKLGFFHPRASRFIGELRCRQLGFAGLAESGVAADCFAWDDAFWQGLAQPRADNTHKGDYGRVVIVAGHARFPGAPRLAAAGCLRAGAGLVRLVVPEPIASASAADPAVMVYGHPASSGGFAAEPDTELMGYLAEADALVIGPGISADDQGSQFMRAVLERTDLPTVVDAGALAALPGQPGERRWPLVLTPHTGELARLAGCPTDVAAAGWFDLGRELAARHQALVLCKSSQSMLALPDQGLIFPRAGTPALAAGGTGDVLAGMLGALLARLRAMEAGAGMPVRTAARLLSMSEVVCTAVNWHSAAGALGAELYGETCLTSSDLPDLLSEALRVLERENSDA